MDVASYMFLMSTTLQSVNDFPICQRLSNLFTAWIVFATLYDCGYFHYVAVSFSFFEYGFSLATLLLRWMLPFECCSVSVLRMTFLWFDTSTTGDLKQLQVNWMQPMNTIFEYGFSVHDNSPNCNGWTGLPVNDRGLLLVSVPSRSVSFWFDAATNECRVLICETIKYCFNYHNMILERRGWFRRVLQLCGWMLHRTNE